MKKQILTLAMALVTAVGLAGLVACSGESEAQTAEVKLPTMQCGACENTIKNVIKDVDGVKDVKMDLKARKATVTFAANVATVAKIENAVSKSGYAANDKKADSEAYAKLPDCCKVGGH